jgi:hypothetical protein
MAWFATQESQLELPINSPRYLCHLRSDFGPQETLHGLQSHSISMRREALMGFNAEPGKMLTFSDRITYVNSDACNDILYDVPVLAASTRMLTY